MRIIKTEGPSDLLALISIGLAEGEIACCNVHGCKENPTKTPWLADFFRDHDVITIHDADEEGLAGATMVGERFGWATFAAASAKTSKLARLPFDVTPNHGKDLRDYFHEGATRVDFDSLIEQAEVVGHPGEAVFRALEANDDPHRLARVNLDRYGKHAGGATIRYWRDEWYTWKPSRGCYRKIGVEELRAKMTHAVKEEFDRINQKETEDYEFWKQSPKYDEAHDKGPPKTQKVIKTLITNVVDATKSLPTVLVPSSVELMSWIDGPNRTRQNYVAMRNGILDLDRLLNDEAAELQDVLLPHSPNWFSMVRLPYEFNPDAKCLKWDKFLERNLEMDPERIKILQEWAGYLLLPETKQQKFLALEGEGSNGKSVFCAAIIALLGTENCSSISVEQLCDKFVRTQTLGKLVNICPDVGAIDKANEGDLKSFTGGDVMFFDRKHLSGLNCIPTARLMMSFNDRPRFSDRSMGIWRRMMLIPFNVQIQEADKVYGMDQSDWWERAGELPGIFLWAVAGLHRLRKQGRFTKSQLSEEAISDYRSETNPARAFLLECVEASAGIKIKTTSLYKFYKTWAEHHGYNKPLGERSFGKEIKRVFPLTERKYSGTRGDRFWCYDGITFSQDEICGTETKDYVMISSQESEQSF